MTTAKRIYTYEDREFEITSFAPDSISIGIKCDDHNHEDFAVSTIEGHTGWGVGRISLGGYILDGIIPFSKVVDHCANALTVECNNVKAIDRIDEMLDSELQEGEDASTLKERLEALAAFLPEFESPGFEFGTMTDRSMTDGSRFYAPSPIAAHFIQTCSDLEWVRPFGWFDWQDSPEANKFWRNPSALSEATSDQLGKFLAVLIRLDRIAEGSMMGAYNSGLLVAILRRAESLAEEIEAEEGDNRD